MINSTHQPDSIASPSALPEEVALEHTLRPQSLDDFIGQGSLKANLNVVIKAAQLRNEPIEHMLFYGPPGLGKTTLAFIIGKTLGNNVKITSGPAIEKAGDLASLLTNLSEGDILFIDEIHRLNKIVEEILYPAMEDGVLDIMIGKGPGARSVRMDLPKFTIVGATTRIGMIAAPLRDRFGLVYRLEYYEPKDLELIISRSAKILNIGIEQSAATSLSARSRYTPRIANRLLKRVRDFAQVTGHDKISESVLKDSLDLLEVDEKGLDKNDRRILEVLAEKFNGGPVGLKTLAAATGEEEDTITDFYEPFLIRLGLIMRTPKGRELTESGYKHVGHPGKNRQGAALFN